MEGCSSCAKVRCSLANLSRREGDSHAYFVEFSVPGYAVGVNVLLYAMTH